MAAYTSHPSVRIKGTENEYEPVQCLDGACIKKCPHWHCPFCVISDFYTDPLILKAHFRVKHVDKGIEFAGLKILRCCDHCDIVGTIKGTKKFKCAHWHCYKCRNGFNRRDEAIKHYRTHFRNPQTTFQIQIAQEVNHRTELTDELSGQELITIHPAIIQAGLTTTSINDNCFLEQSSPDDSESAMPSLIDHSSSSSNSKPSTEVHVSVAANETVGTCESGQSVQPTMIIIEQGENILKSLDMETIKENPDYRQPTKESLDQRMEEPLNWCEEKAALQNEIYSLQQQVRHLEAEKCAVQSLLQTTKDQLEKQAVMFERREQDLLQKLLLPGPERISSLLSQLKADHESLLHQQLLLLQESFNHDNTKTTNDNKTVTEDDGVTTVYVEDCSPASANPEDQAGNKIWKLSEVQSDSGTDGNVSDHGLMEKDADTCCDSQESESMTMGNQECMLILELDESKEKEVKCHLGWDDGATHNSDRGNHKFKRLKLSEAV